MVDIGTVTGQEIRKNRDGGVDVRLLQVQRVGNDVQTVQYMPMAGDDSPPRTGDLVAMVPIGPAFQVGLGMGDSVIPSVAAGEKKLYSRDENGDVVASIHLKADGEATILNANGQVTLKPDGAVLLGVANEAQVLGDAAVTFLGAVIDEIITLCTAPTTMGSVLGADIATALTALKADMVANSDDGEIRSNKHKTGLT